MSTITGINVSYAGQRMPTDDEIIQRYTADPTPETMKRLCRECRSESRPIRVLCEAGMMGTRAVRSCELEPAGKSEEKSESQIRFTREQITSVLRMKAKGKSNYDIAETICLSRRQVEFICYKYKNRKKGKKK